MAHVTAIIPARLESRRFPRKVLHPFNGRPLIYYPWREAARSKKVNRLFVATDSTEVGRAVNAFGGAVVMTSRKPRNGSERAAEAVAAFRTDIVVNIQADNVGPIGPVIDRVVGEMEADPRLMFATVARRIDSNGWAEKLYNPDVVKAVVGVGGEALWFSRYPIPFVRGASGKRAVGQFPFLEHIGLYFFRRKALLQYIQWPMGRAEKAESLEQLRILENGGRIRVYPIRADVVSINNRQSLEKLESKKSRRVKRG